ncbi:MAG TPA: HEAT repeat domain-containing protein [Methanolinea sp.]|nr:MAG: putative lyase [Methanoregulaceae archaeon PtaB.Bin009]OPY37830.1 MAG: putative lyase [Methanoregulaceae archaeon PtaU1.Bin066]HII76267.1 HEAT repeat domain-containing protein [Methanolinea sp.]HNQ30650.1 HEAT repeat domain-containing protein [Methanolinea sp.]
MIPAWILDLSTPDVQAMKERRDYHGLTKALRHRDPRVQWKAARALGDLGEESLDHLIGALETTWNREARLGIIEALGLIGGPRVVSPLVAQMEDRSNEVRWEAAMALGETGDLAAIPALRKALEDEDKYVRYGAALSLQKLSWQPETKRDEAFLRVGLQEWDTLTGPDSYAVEALGNAIRDQDKNVRLEAVKALGALRAREAAPILYRAISDPDEEVRWESVLAAPACGLPLRFLPRALARRPRARKNPIVAGFLNFMLPGMGYMYIGLWWGLLIFQVDVYATLWTFAATGEFISFSVLFPVYLILALHAWYMARQMPDL